MNKLKLTNIALKDIISNNTQIDSWLSDYYNLNITSQCKINKNKSLPWIEKYRPQKLQDLIGNNEIKTIFNNILKYKLETPHFLFYGPPGTGKTSAILAFAHELYGDTFNDNVLEINASDNNSIDSIRNIVLAYTKNKTKINNNNVKHTIIILDEADALTEDAQFSLRKIIEDYTNTTKFCIICNYLNKIIYPLISRCIKISFHSLNSIDITKQLKFISMNEKLQLSDDIIDSINETSSGDLRKSIGILQNLKYLYKKVINITPKLVYDINCDVPLNFINKFMTLVKQKKYNEIYYKVTSESISIKKICEKILTNYTLTIKQVNLLYKILRLINNGADEKIQLLNLIYNLD